jgi:uncharacterized RDD family membrane protein YckC
VDAFLVGFVLGILGGDALPDGPAFNVVLLVAVVLYETVLLTIAGRTVGKMLFGLRVVRIDRAPLAPARRADPLGRDRRHWRHPARVGSGRDRA